MTITLPPHLEKRIRELMEFLIEPAAALIGRRFVVHGVRYPEHGVQQLHQAGIDYRGYLPNLRSPKAYSQRRLRRFQSRDRQIDS